MSNGVGASGSEIEGARFQGRLIAQTAQKLSG
jgi:hypothetical protein